MNKRIVSRFDRARLYLECVRDSISKADQVQGMEDSAELGYQVQALYKEFEAVLKTHKINGKPLTN